MREMVSERQQQKQNYSIWNKEKMLIYENPTLHMDNWLISAQRIGVVGKAQHSHWVKEAEDRAPSSRNGWNLQAAAMERKLLCRLETPEVLGGDWGVLAEE